ncbi:MAG: nucleoside-diphosphate kinase [Bacilli bacterium]|nr:nucleoside-diphosphate kinase [Bacilli bacterium]MDD4733323.1 nucleoside-diphosphate kinase [Bacilli bacterium]
MEKNIEYTYIMIKPDGVSQNVMEDVIKRFSLNNLEVSHVKQMKLDEKILREHYAHVVERDFYPEMESHMMSGPVIAMIVKGENAIAKTRELMGPTANAQPGTIRGDYRHPSIVHKNVIHGSDSVENAKIEIARFYDGLTIENL